MPGLGGINTGAINAGLAGSAPSGGVSPALEDYWATGPFPAVRFAILPPSRRFIGTAAWYVNIGLGDTLVDTNPPYPLENLWDGVGSTVASNDKFSTGQLRIDLGSAQTPDIFALVNHNFDYGLPIYIEASNSSVFASTTYQALIFARRPTCWMDLRNASFAASRYWRARIDITANTPGRLKVGEVVIGNGYFFEGGIEEGSIDLPAHAHVRRAYTEYEAPYKMLAESRQRAVRMTLRLTPAMRATWATVSDEVGLAGGRVLVIPSTLVHEAYFVEWPVRSEQRFPASYLEATVPIELLEESMGVL